MTKRKLIDADELLKGLYDENPKDVALYIANFPEAQPEIIKCKDCKHWKYDHTCREHSLVSPMSANEYCSRAERRTDER